MAAKIPSFFLRVLNFAALPRQAQIG